MENDAAHDLNVLVDVARRLGETFELDKLLHTIEQAGRSALDCERATVFLCDPDRGELFSKVGTGIDEIRFPTSKGIAGEAVRTRAVILVPDAYADSRFNPEIDRSTGYHTRNLLTLPLIAPDGEVVGVLQVLNKIGGDFTSNDQVLAAALGSLTGVAIKRQMLMDEAAEKQRLERELNIAREIQQRLLPETMPEVPGFELAGWNLPADATGGDMYDAFALRGGQVGLMIADATGHGIGPALIISQCRSVLRALAATDDEPARLVGCLNNLLCDDLPSDRFVTLCFGRLDPDRHRLDYVSAGHGPQIHFRPATGEFYMFRATGVPLGVMPDAPLELAEPILFDVGDIFILLTDGFSEWCNSSDEQYGCRRLEKLIAREHRRPCNELIQAIYRDVLQFCGGTPQLDDLTIVVAKRIV